MLTLKPLSDALTVCKVPSVADIDLSAGFFFIGRTDEELSLVCRTADTPERTAAREDGWRGFRVEGTLDFSLTGILAGLAGVLADRKIGIFAVSTYNTDYILVKAEAFGRALAALAEAGYRISAEEGA
ncbi:MAG: ACT domain-containing protein [Clostridia bacterium]|nr:ACT domain-containing protein [Clostridia bacterium]